MAERIEHAPQSDPREVLLIKLAQAPQEHAEALLDVFEIVQMLHDKGVLELLKGALGSGEKILVLLTKTLESGEVLSLVRNIVVLTKIIGGLNPEMLEEIEHRLVVSAAEAKEKSPPGLLKLFGKLRMRESRQVLNSIFAVIEAFGSHMQKGTAESPALRGLNRKKATRHSG